VIALSRRKKADSGLSLNTPIRALEIYTNPEQLTVLRENEEVILRTLKAEKLILAEARDFRIEIFT